MAIVTLKKGEGRTIKSGGMWIFDNEIASIMGSFEDGDNPSTGYQISSRTSWDVTNAQFTKYPGCASEGDWCGFLPENRVAGELSSNMLFADYLDQWLEIVRARIKPATFGSYQGMVKSTIGPYFRKKELTLKELEARHIQQFYTEKLKTVTPNSVIHYHAVIYQALKYAMKTDMVPQNVAMKVDRPRKNSFQPTFLDAEQMQKLFEIVKGTRLELPVLVAAFYGLRRGEVLGLKWDAIDFNRGTLTIKRTVTEATIDGTMKIIEQDSAKTKSSLRTLPLVGSFRDYFQKVKEAQELNKKVCGNCYNYEYDGYVFVNELGERMRPNYLTEYFPKYIAKHGMPKMRFHDLRHSCASLCRMKSRFVFMKT